jgi:hypothetical protein
MADSDSESEMPESLPKFSIGFIIQPSCDINDAASGNSTSTIASLSTPHPQQLSPPVTPEVIRTKRTKVATSTKTPTRLGSALAGHQPLHPPTTTLDQCRTEQTQHDLIAQHKHYIHRRGIPSTTQRFKATHWGNCVAVAKTMVLGPPTDPTFSKQRDFALGTWHCVLQQQNVPSRSMYI